MFVASITTIARFLIYFPFRPALAARGLRVHGRAWATCGAATRQRRVRCRRQADCPYRRFLGGFAQKRGTDPNRGLQLFTSTGDQGWHALRLWEGRGATSASAPRLARAPGARPAADENGTTVAAVSALPQTGVPPRDRGDAEQGRCWASRNSALPTATTRWRRWPASCWGRAVASAGPSRAGCIGPWSATLAPGAGFSAGCEATKKPLESGNFSARNRCSRNRSHRGNRPWQQWPAANPAGVRGPSNSR